MAVIQISKMQVRRGQTAQTNFPQLSSGEFGWSIDQQELFIGNGAVIEGAPAVGNTQIITEHNINNFFLLARSYTYGDGLVPNTQVRTVQSKLDDIVNLADFILVDPNITITEYSTIIQNAISYAASIGRPLYFPEGTYVINSTSTITIPANTEIRGAGAGKTIIDNQSTSTIFQTVDGASNTFGPSYALVGQPTNIRINGLTLKSTVANSNPILQLDCVSDTIIEQCTFQGDASTSSQATAINLRDISSYPANLTDNVAIKNCVFYQLGSAIVSDYDISNIIVSENKFKDIDAGLMLGKTPAAGTVLGPRRIQITNNVFSNINQQAIYSGSTSTAITTDINSVNNLYYDVGNNGNGDSVTSQATEVIYFGSFGNYSNGDTFDRMAVINSGTSFISSSTSAIVKPLINGPAIVKSKSPAMFSRTITPQNSQPLFGYPRNTYQFGANAINQVITIEYTLVKPSISLTRRGTLDIIVSGATATVRDDFTTTGSIDISNRLSFYAEVNTAKNLIILLFNGNGDTNSGTIEYTYTVKQ
jgi:hypothetical protein